MKRNIVLFALAMLALLQFESCSKTAPAPSAKPAPQTASAESSKAPVVDSGKPGAYKIGDTGPAGGIVFYDKGNDKDGWRYLEAAPSDQSDTGIQWGNGNNIDIKTGTAVGTGKANTEAIIAAQGSGDYAATLCKNLSINGFSDWFLPSMDELNLMYANMKKAGLGGLGEGWLWSSSQYGGSNAAWVQDMSDGSQTSGAKDREHTVRACRAFEDVPSAASTKAVTPDVVEAQTIYKIGDTGPAGGVVFYVKGFYQDGWRYLETAPSDQSNGIQWYNGKDLNIMTDTAIGSGKTNTDAIIAAQGVGNYAASLCKDLSINGFSDWFLPSQDELGLMYKNLKKAGLGGFSEKWYWSSSSELSDLVTYAWVQAFLDGSKDAFPRNGNCLVRACRAF